jgi:hypothetical protein
VAVKNSLDVIVITDAQEADIYTFTGWPQAFLQTEMAPVEMALRQIANKPGMLARITNSLFATPKGILAQLNDLHDVQMPAAYERLAARKVGTIELAGSGELNELARQGERLVGLLCSTLFIKRGNNIFKPGSGRGWDAAMGFPVGGSSRGNGDNWIGK